MAWETLAFIHPLCHLSFLCLFSILQHAYFLSIFLFLMYPELSGPSLSCPNWLECFSPRPQLPSTLFLLLILQVSPELKPCSSNRLEGQVITQLHSIWRILIGAGGGKCSLGSYHPILLPGLPHTGVALMGWGTLTALGVLHISFLASPGTWRSGSR